MSDQFIITKDTRLPAGTVVQATSAYSGPTCERAGVEPGRIYSSRAEAKPDAQLLSEFNGVGFYVLEVGKPFDKARRDHYVNGRKQAAQG